MQPLPDREFIARRRSGDAGISDRDFQLAFAAVRALCWDPRTRHEPVRVSAQNDIIILTGTVRSWGARQAAGSVARQTEGADDFCDAMSVDAEAADSPPLDEFDRLIRAFGLRRPAAESSQPGSGRLRAVPVELAVPLVSWLVLPWLVVAAVLPVIAALLIGLVVTVACLLVGIFRRSSR